MYVQRSDAMCFVLGGKVRDEFHSVSLADEQRVHPRAEIEAGGMFL